MKIRRPIHTRQTLASGKACGRALAMLAKARAEATALTSETAEITGVLQAAWIPSETRAQAFDAIVRAWLTD